MGPFYAGARPGGLPLFSQVIYPCKDGHVFLLLTGAAQAGMVASSKALVEMANREGIALELKDYPWQTIDAATISQEELTRLTDAICEFIKTKTKAELSSVALEKGILLAPLTTVKDVAENPQFATRGFWQQVEHPELDTTITYPGYPIKLNEVPYQIQRRAPLIGEHNEEIYEKELGFSQEQLVILKNCAVI